MDKFSFLSLIWLCRLISALMYYVYVAKILCLYIINWEYNGYYKKKTPSCVTPRFNSKQGTQFRYRPMRFLYLKNIAGEVVLFFRGESLQVAMILHIYTGARTKARWYAFGFICADRILTRNISLYTQFHASTIFMWGLIMCSRIYWLDCSLRSWGCTINIPSFDIYIWVYMKTVVLLFAFLSYQLVLYIDIHRHIYIYL